VTSLELMTEDQAEHRKLQVDCKQTELSGNSKLQ
jgi:hypothetical protein